MRFTLSLVNILGIALTCAPALACAADTQRLSPNATSAHHALAPTHFAGLELRAVCRLTETDTRGRIWRDLTSAGSAIAVASDAGASCVAMSHVDDEGQPYFVAFFEIERVDLGHNRSLRATHAGAFVDAHVYVGDKLFSLELETGAVDIAPITFTSAERTTPER